MNALIVLVKNLGKGPELCLHFVDQIHIVQIPVLNKLVKARKQGEILFAAHLLYVFPVGKDLKIIHGRNVGNVQIVHGIHERNRSHMDIVHRHIMLPGCSGILSLGKPSPCLRVDPAPGTDLILFDLLVLLRQLDSRVKIGRFIFVFKGSKRICLKFSRILLLVIQRRQTVLQAPHKSRAGTRRIDCCLV